MYRYTKTQSLYLSRKGVLPEIVDLFGMAEDSPTTPDKEIENEEVEELSEEITSDSEVIKEPEIHSPPMNNDNDDIDSFFG